MRFACWITKATDTRLEYLILTAPPRRWLRERASMITFIRTSAVLPVEMIISVRVSEY